MGFDSRDSILKETRKIISKLRNSVFKIENLPNAELKKIRKKTLTLLRKTIIFYANSNCLDLWEKSAILQALNCFSCSYSAHNPTELLWVSLLEIEQSTLVYSDRNKEKISKEIDKIDRNKLLDMVRSLSVLG